MNSNDEIDILQVKASSKPYSSRTRHNFKKTKSLNDYNTMNVLFHNYSDNSCSCVRNSYGKLSCQICKNKKLDKIYGRNEEDYESFGDGLTEFYD